VIKKNAVFKTFKINQLYSKIKGSGKDLIGYFAPFVKPSCALWLKKYPQKKPNCEVELFVTSSRFIPITIAD